MLDFDITVFIVENTILIRPTSHALLCCAFKRHVILLCYPGDVSSTESNFQESQNVQCVHLLVPHELLCFIGSL